MNQLFRNRMFWGLSLLFLFTSSCTPEKEKEESKLIEFEYFEKNAAVERYIKWNNDAVYVTLPSCFLKENYYDFSLTNEQNFICDETHTFFSIDRIPEEDMNEYRTYFQVEDKTKSSSSDEEIILEYIVDTRLSNLVGSSFSKQSTIESFKQKEILTVSVKGRSDNYQNDLFYQFGAITFNGVTYLIQFVVNEEDVYYYHKDIIKIFKSIRHA